MQVVWRGRVQQISWAPRAFLLHSFLSDDECDHLINISKGKLHKSSVVDVRTGGSVASDVRTSTGAFLSYHQDEVVARIEKRLSLVTMLPEENGETLHILRYVDGQKYEPHTGKIECMISLARMNSKERRSLTLIFGCSNIGCQRWYLQLYAPTQ